MGEPGEKDALVASFHRASNFASYVAKRHPLIFALLYWGYKNYRRKIPNLVKEFGPEVQE